MSQGSHGSHDLGKHALIMLLCCLVPVALLVIIWYTGFSSSTLTALVPLLCPILMFLGMALMMRHKNNTQPDGSVPPDHASTDNEHKNHCDK